MARPLRVAAAGLSMTNEGSSVRVLVVDDRLEMAEMIADDLGNRGYDTLAVSSGQGALRLLTTERIDALITDLRMPGIDGLELLRASRALDPCRPVILMTTFAALDTAIEASEVGIGHFLTKPFRLDLLARLLKQVIDLRRAPPDEPR
jgi:DNA-binding NtrC family response regulator